jgi:hypothetical protein
VVTTLLLNFIFLLFVSLLLEGPLKELGMYTVKVELHPEARDDYEAAPSGKDWHETSWGTTGAPVRLFREHEAAMRDRDSAGLLIRLMTGDLPGSPPMIGELEDLPQESRDKWKGRLRGYYEQRIKRIRTEMRGHGLTPPRLPFDLAHLDEF